MKNPLAYLKHIVKDPIKTIAEADERKKEIMPLLYGSGGALLVGVILQVAVKLDFMAVLSFIGLVGVAFSGFLLTIVSSAKKKFEALTCTRCNTMFHAESPEVYRSLVSYEVLSENTKSSISHPASNNGVVSYVKVSGESTAVLKVSFKCPSCGEIKELKYTITPFKCEREQKNVRVADVELVKINLENAMKVVLEKYNSDERSEIPYSIQSVHHPDYANRAKPQLSKNRPVINGVSILYRREIDEMVEGLFIHNELNGSIVDPNKSKK